MGGGLISRMLRALRLDPTLYREVAAPGDSTFQAAAVVLLAAVSTGLALGAGVAAYWTTTWFGLETTSDNLGIVRDVAAGIAGSIALAHVAAWPVWSAGLWVVSRRMTESGAQAPGFRQIARALAFAQVPAIFGGLIVLLITGGGVVLGPSALLGLGVFSGLFANIIWTVVLCWVLVGTYLAVREGLGLPSGRALASLLIVGATLAAILCVVLILVTVIVVARGAEPSYLGRGSWAPIGLDYGDAITSPIVARSTQSTAAGFDFNLGLSLSAVFIYHVADMLAGTP